MLPRSSSGFELGEFGRLPVVLNSAYSSYKDNFLSWAADAYVIKSSDTGELRQAVAGLLSGRPEDRPRRGSRNGLAQSEP